MLLSGSIGEHGMAIMLARGEFELDASIESDTAPLWPAVDALLDDSLFMEARWRMAGAPTELRIWQEAPHGFLNLPMSVTAAALSAEHDFLRRTLELARR